VNSVLGGKTQEDVDAEMKRLQLELRQTMEMYNEACKEAVTARERERKQVGRAASPPPPKKGFFFFNKKKEIQEKRW